METGLGALTVASAIANQRAALFLVSKDGVFRLVLPCDMKHLRG